MLNNAKFLIMILRANTEQDFTGNEIRDIKSNLILNKKSALSLLKRHDLKN